MVALLAKALMAAVVFHAPCPGLEASQQSCAIRPNVIYMDPGPLTQPSDLQHELGHVIDYNFLTDSDRGTFEALMRMRRPWIDSPNSPHEQFAEAVRYCSLSMRTPPKLGGAYGYEPTRLQHRKVCRWLASVG